MRTDDYYSVQELAKSLQIDTSTIYRWIHAEKIQVTKEDNHYLIPVYENRDFFIQQIRIKSLKAQSSWIPKELSKYNSWHEIIDQFGWLIKICYSSKMDIKNRKFRVDRLFINYLKFHNISKEKVRNIFLTNPNKNVLLITDDLKRGWYNELAFSFPLKEATLGLSFSDIETNKNISERRFSFPSWRITTSYYTIYFYIRSITLLKQTGYRIEEHSATLNSFKNCVFQPLSNALWKFPFDIIYIPGKRFTNQTLKNKEFEYLKYGYCNHPRPPHYSARQLIDKIYNTYKKNGKRTKNNKRYSFFDFLHDFRIWANYLDINNLLSLWGPGYKAFLDQNLSLILFFIGGFSEICFLAVYEVDKYMSELQNFYDSFVSNNKELVNDFVNTPVYQRHLLYYQLGWIDKKIKLKKPENPNKIINL